MKVTIITPSIRKDGLKTVHNSLRKQSHQDFEWLIGSPFDPEIPDAHWIKDSFTDGYWSLNRMYNLLFLAASSDLIISWQDWIYAAPDGLDKFISNFETVGPRAIISGVGDQYESIDKFGRPQVKIWSDPRKNLQNGSFYECYPNDAEWNWCAIPRDAIKEAGGMDEQLDFLGYGGDQLQMGARLDALGYRFYLDQTNESYTIRHDRSDFGGQENWDGNHIVLNGKYDARIKELKAKGKWPKLDYLK